MQTSGGARGGYQSLRRQVLALAACRVSLGLTDTHRISTIDATPIRRFDAWLQHDDAQECLWPGVIELSETFYTTLLEHAVPLDPRAMASLRHSALALDIYTWLAHRLRRVAGPGGTKLSWSNLWTQFGQEYGSVKDFKKQFKIALRQAMAVYPDANVTGVVGGIVLRSSRSPIHGTRVSFAQ